MLMIFWEDKLECKVYVIYGLGFNDSFNGSGKIKLSM